MQFRNCALEAFPFTVYGQNLKTLSFQALSYFSGI